MGLLSFPRRPAPPARVSPRAERLLEIAKALRSGGPVGMMARPEFGGAPMLPGARRGPSPGAPGLLAGLGAGARGSLLPGRGRRR